MDDEKLKKQIGINIVAHRKRWGMTQAKLAEKLNYSDKAVSKWERGESAPDVLTMVQLAELFGVTVDELLADPNALPENTGKVQRAMGKAVEKTFKRKADKKIILQLSSLLVWFVALLLFVVMSYMELPQSWIAFVYALPANGIVALSLCSAWHEFRWNRIFVSAIMWGGLLSVYTSLIVFAKISVGKIFLLGILGQIAVLLWFRLFRTQKEEKHG